MCLDIKKKPITNTFLLSTSRDQQIIVLDKRQKLRWEKIDPVRWRLWWGGLEAVEVEQRRNAAVRWQPPSALPIWIELSSAPHMDWSSTIELSSSWTAHMAWADLSFPYGFRDQRLPTALFSPLSGTFWYFFPHVWYFLVFSLCLVFTFVYRSPGWYLWAPNEDFPIPEKVSLFICGTFAFLVFIVLSMYGVDHDQATAKVLMHLGT